MYIFKYTDEVSTIWKGNLEKCFLDMGQFLTEYCEATLYFSLEIRPNCKRTPLPYNV
jgi:hypothetical protein